MTEHGKIYWNELMTNDVEGAKAFYAATAGWQFVGEEMDKEGIWKDGGTYWIAMTDSGPAAGIMALPPHVPADTPPHWTAYVAVEDVDDALKRATDGGADVLMEPFEVPNVGRIVTLRDPQGAVIALITPSQDG